MASPHIIKTRSMSANAKREDKDILADDMEDGSGRLQRFDSADFAMSGMSREQEEERRERQAVEKKKGSGSQVLAKRLLNKAPKIVSSDSIGLDLDMDFDTETDAK